MQQLAVYLFTLRSLYMFRMSSHPLSGVHKTVTAASGTGHIIVAATPTWPTVCCNLWYNAPTMLPANGRQHCGCIIPQAVYCILCTA